MSTTTRHIMKLPDLGEGTVSAEVIAWKVAPGDLVREDAPLVEMSTEKAVVEVPAPVSGRVISLGGKPGDTIAVGAELAVFAIETIIEGAPKVDDAREVEAALKESAAAAAVAAAAVVESRSVPRTGGRIMASPATRRRAFEAGIDLATVQGSGPQGRILARDLGAARAANAAPAVTEIPVIGIRRLIAQRMSEAKRVAPHFAYVEEVDVTELEALRVRCNAERAADAPALTYLPFIVRALGKR